MAVSTKTILTLDMNSGAKKAHNRNVHYIKVFKNNRKGTAAAVGGELHDHLGAKNGDFHISLVTKVNGKFKTVQLNKGDVVFQTEDSNRWQVMTLKGFQKRFPEAKV